MTSLTIPALYIRVYRDHVIVSRLGYSNSIRETFDEPISSSRVLNDAKLELAIRNALERLLPATGVAPPVGLLHLFPETNYTFSDHEMKALQNRRKELGVKILEVSRSVVPHSEQEFRRILA